MLKILNKKKKGFIITVEVMFTSLLFVLLLMGCTNILKLQEKQKYVYNCLINGVIITSKWGGTNSTLYKTQSRTDLDIEQTINNEIQRVGYTDVYLSLSPENINSTNGTVTGTITWTDNSFWLWKMSVNRQCTLQTDSITGYGNLLNQ